MPTEDYLDPPRRKPWKRPTRCPHGFTVPTNSVRPGLCQVAGCVGCSISLKGQLQTLERKVSRLEERIRLGGIEVAPRVPLHAGRVLDELEAIDQSELEPDEIDLVERLTLRAEALEGIGVRG